MVALIVGLIGAVAGVLAGFLMGAYSEFCRCEDRIDAERATAAATAIYNYRREMAATGQRDPYIRNVA